MRLISVAVALFAIAPSVVALPAAAQSRADADAARRLNDPVVQEGLAAAVSALAGIVLDTRIGPLADYSDDIRPGDTLRDVERRRDPAFEARLHDDARHAIATAGRAASNGVAMSAELRRTADRLRAALAPLASAYARHAAGAASDDY